MSQTAINPDFSENEKETNTMQHEDSAKALPGSLAELLLRILRHSKCNQGSAQMSVNQENFIPRNEEIGRLTLASNYMNEAIEC